MILSINGTHDEKTIDQIKNVDEKSVYTALMADGHLGYIMPIGGVAAYDGKVSISGVGYDIACGNCAIQTNTKIENIKNFLTEIADSIANEISFGVGRKNASGDAPTEHELFNSDCWEILPKVIRESLKEKARSQLGTVGSGNHYVDVFSDESGYIWVGVHFGSRGLGHTIASGFLSVSANEKWGTKVPEHDGLIDLNTELGIDYWEMMQLAGEYAYAGRRWVAEKVAKFVGSTENIQVVHNNHNFAWKEKHFGTDLVVIRKGATPAFDGQMGFVGGSMGDDSVILCGVNSEQSELNLNSTVHGAGRVMSRNEARGKINRKTGEIKSVGKVSQEMMNDWLGRENVILRGGGLDEAPQAYRRLGDVLSAHHDTIRILHTLKPLIVVMAGENEYDPYKD